MARRLRSGTWGPGVGAGRAPGSVENGQAIAEWLAAYGPVLASAFAEQEWPETVVCDSTRFMYTNRRTGTTRQLFCVLGVWGYPAGEKEGRLWRLAASPDQDSRAWQHVLASLPGRPSSVVCDRDYAIIDAVRATWGKGRNAVPVHLCEHHLYERAKKALAEDGITEFGHRLHELLNEAFTTQPAGRPSTALRPQLGEEHDPGPATGTRGCERRWPGGRRCPPTTATVPSSRTWWKSTRCSTGAAGPSETWSA
ncbi:MAG TPA: hypothetical protein VFN61_10135 [Acidimicrobiales bacterium]|nr:hypothetical protein [Acidimicrobiales bacterium]